MFVLLNQTRDKLTHPNIFIFVSTKDSFITIWYKACNSIVWECNSIFEGLEINDLSTLIRFIFEEY